MRKTPFYSPVSRAVTTEPYVYLVLEWDDEIFREPGEEKD